MKSIITLKTIEKSTVSIFSIPQIASMVYFVQKPTHLKKLKLNFCVSWILMTTFSCFITKQSSAQSNGNIIIKSASMPTLGKILEEISSSILMVTACVRKLILKAEFAKVLWNVIFHTLGTSFNFILWITRRMIVTMNNVRDISVLSCTLAKAADSDKLTNFKTSTFILSTELFLIKL